MKRIIILVAVLTTVGSALAAPAPEEFGKLPSIFDAAISPDARQLAIIVNVRGTWGVRILTIEKLDDKPRIKLLAPGIKPNWIKWANDSQVLVGLWQSKKRRTTPITYRHIYTMNANTLDGKILIQARELYRQNNSKVVDFLEDDPDFILMAFSDEDQFISDIQRVNVVTGRYIRVKRGSANIQRWYTDLRGEPRVGQGISDRSKKTKRWTLRIRDAEADNWRPSKNYPGLEADTDIFGFTADPNELVIGHRAGKQTNGLYIYDLGEKQITRTLFHNNKYDARGLIRSADGKDVIGATFVADAREVELFGEHQTALGRIREKFRDYTVDYIDRSRNGEIILFKLSNAHSPGVLVMLNTITRDIKQLAMYRRGLPSTEMGIVATVHYPARDGFKIPAYVTLPPSITDQSQFKNIPFVVLPHGGPHARSSQRFDYFAQFFATRGFGVLQMNFRGSAGYGKSFEDAGRENWIVMQEDVEDGTRWLIEKGYADPERTCIAGWSYGGYAALMGAIKNADLYACAISMAGVTDLRDMIDDIKKYRFGSIKAHDFILRGFDGKKELKKNSPAKRARELTVPLFLAHGTRDQRVHFDQYKRMRSALRKSTAKVTYMKFKDEDHFLSNQKNRQEFFVGLDKFLKQTVGESEHAL